MFSVKSEVHNFIVFKSNDNIVCIVILNDFCLRITLKLNICISLHTCTCRDNLTEDNILFKTDERINLTLDSGICKNSCCFLE